MVTHGGKQADKKIAVAHVHLTVAVEVEGPALVDIARHLAVALGVDLLTVRGGKSITHGHAYLPPDKKIVTVPVVQRLLGVQAHGL